MTDRHYRFRDQPRRFIFSEIILGGQDGLVNVLGVILGVAAASQDPRLVIAAGLAATFAESISMGAVAYTSTMSDAENYQAESNRELRHIANNPDIERDEIRQIYQAKGFRGQLLEQVVTQITSDQQVWLDTMIAEELKIEKVEKSHARRAGWIVGISAIVGSFIPLLPFFFSGRAENIFLTSIVAIIITALTLFVLGVYKAKYTVGQPARSGLTLAMIGTISAMVGYLIGWLFKVPSM